MGDEEGGNGDWEGEHMYEGSEKKRKKSGKEKINYLFSYSPEYFSYLNTLWLARGCYRSSL